MNGETHIDHANSHANIGWGSREKWRALRNQCVVTVPQIVTVIRNHYGGRSKTLDHVNDQLEELRYTHAYVLKFALDLRGIAVSQLDVARIYGNDSAAGYERTLEWFSGNVVSDAGNMENVTPMQLE